MLAVPPKPHHWQTYYFNNMKYCNKEIQSMLPAHAFIGACISALLDCGLSSTIYKKLMPKAFQTITLCSNKHSALHVCKDQYV